MTGHTDCSIPDEVVAALEARMQSGPFRRDDLIAMVVEMTGMHRVDADTAVGYRLQKARKAGLIQTSRSNRFIWVPAALMKPRRIREVSAVESNPLPHEPRTLRQRVIAGLCRLIDRLTPCQSLPDDGSRTANSRPR